MTNENTTSNQPSPFEMSGLHISVQANAVGVTAAPTAPEHQRVIMSVFENQLEPFCAADGDSGIRLVRKAVATIAMEETVARQMLTTLQQTLDILAAHAVKGKDSTSTDGE